MLHSSLYTVIANPRPCTPYFCEFAYCPRGGWVVLGEGVGGGGKGGTWSRLCPDVCVEKGRTWAFLFRTK